MNLFELAGIDVLTAQQMEQHALVMHGVAERLREERPNAKGRIAEMHVQARIAAWGSLCAWVRCVRVLAVLASDGTSDVTTLPAGSAALARARSR